jgi:predicted nucleic acid-binding protein
MGTIAGTIVKMQGKKVYFDTNVLAYVFGNTPHFVEASLPFFEAIEQGVYKGFTGDITLGELLVKPAMDNDLSTSNQLKSFFDKAHTVSLISHTREDFEMMAQIRAHHKLKAIDAIQVATAIRCGCSFLVTGDKSMAEGAAGIETVNINQWVNLSPTTVG